MKNKPIKGYLKSMLLLLGTCLFAIGCQSEDQEEVTDIANDKTEDVVLNITGQRITNAVYSNNSGLTNRISALATNTSSRATNGTGLDILQHEALYLELGNYHSYTFGVDNAQILPLQNVTFSYDGNGSYDAYLVTYNIDQDEYQRLMDGQPVDLDGKTSAVPIGLDSSQYINTAQRNGSSCSTHIIQQCITVPTCDYGGHVHVAGDNCTQVNGTHTACQPVSIISNCPAENIPGDNGSGETTGGGSNAGSNTNNDQEGTLPCDDVPSGQGLDIGNGQCITGNGLTGPLLPAPLDFDDNNCNELKKLSNTDDFSANINPIVTELRTKTELGKEYSISFRKNINGGEEYNIPDSNGIQEGKSKTESDINTGTVWFGGIHTHPKDTYPMFSWADVNRLRNVYDELHADFTKDDVFIMIVNHDDTVYALKINNILTLTTKLNEELANTKGATESEKEKTLNKNMQREYRKDSDNERAFLKKFNNYGIGLYKANDQNLSNWSRLELDDPTSDNPNVNAIPCD